MKNVDTSKNYLQKILWEMGKVIEKSFVPNFKNLMTICGLFETQLSTSFYKIPKNIKIFICSKN